MSKHKPIPIRYGKHVVGTIEWDGPIKIFVITRKGRHRYQSMPCDLHTMCSGFTISRTPLMNAMAMGAKVVKLKYRDVDDEWESNLPLNDWLTGAKLEDDHGNAEYGLPEHVIEKFHIDGIVQMRLFR